MTRRRERNLGPAVPAPAPPSPKPLLALDKLTLYLYAKHNEEPPLVQFLKAVIDPTDGNGLQAAEIQALCATVPVLVADTPQIDPAGAGTHTYTYYASGEVKLVLNVNYQAEVPTAPDPNTIPILNLKLLSDIVTPSPNMIRNRLESIFGTTPADRVHSKVDFKVFVDAAAGINVVTEVFITTDNFVLSIGGIA